MVAGGELPASVEFRRFRVLPHRRELLVDGQPAKLGGRAFDILTTLIKARGGVVTKDALMARVWPGQIVEENNLQSHISALRAALCRDRELIRTVSGRGYQGMAWFNKGQTPELVVQARGFSIERSPPIPAMSTRSSGLRARTWSKPRSYLSPIARRPSQPPKRN
jgi:DNA-binding winged helix-turn-helix (wHTH) protein